MKALLGIAVAAVSLAFADAEAWSAEIIPDQSITFYATFESRKEVQEYLSAFFRPKGYRLNPTTEGLHFLFVGMPNEQHAVAHGSIRMDASVCILVDIYSEEARSAVKDRSSTSRARTASEAAELASWLKGAGATSIQRLEARPWHERSECLGARSNTSLERTRAR